MHMRAAIPRMEGYLASPPAGTPTFPVLLICTKESCCFRRDVLGFARERDPALTKLLRGAVINEREKLG